MEDQKRGMEYTEEGIPPVEKKPHRMRDLTIMVVRSVGKVHSFKISSRIILLAIISLLIYIPISILHINWYWDQRSAYNAQSEEVKLLEKDASKRKKNLQRFEQHVALLEDYIHNLEEPREEEDDSTKGEIFKERIAALGVEYLSADKGEEKQTANVVDVKDMNIKIEGYKMIINFKLVNVEPGGDAVGGYVHIIAIDKDDNSPPELTYPKEKVENGFPLNPRRGQLFLIQRFKPINGNFNLIPDSEPPTTIKVLVYDRSGLLILEKRFEVSSAS